MGSPGTTEHAPEHGNPDEKARTPAAPPAAPNPESDAGLLPAPKSPVIDDADLTPESVDIHTLKAVSAMKLLCRNVDMLVAMTGDIPPTPASARSPGHRLSTSSRSQAEHRSSNASISTPKRDAMNYNLQVPGARQSFSHESIDGIPLKLVGSPESIPFSPQSPPTEGDVGRNAQSTQAQAASLARRFYSKRAPPISTLEYLSRLHKYCPMSTAVYVATAHYITHLAVEEKVIPVTPRNIHRLLLAGLRVAMKALEDLSWPHSRFAKVGGVSEVELGKLEVSFCFLMDFGLRVNAEQLQSEAESLCRSSQANENAVLDSPADVSSINLRIPEGRVKSSSTGGPVGGMQGSPSRNVEKRKASSALPSRPAFRPVGGIEAVVNG